MGFADFLRASSGSFFSGVGRRAFVVIVMAATVSFSACSGAADTGVAADDPAGDGPIRLRILMLERDGLKTSGEDYIREILALAEDAFMKEFGVAIEFDADIDFKSDDRPEEFCRELKEKRSDRAPNPIMLSENVYEVLSVMRDAYVGKYEDLIEVIPLDRRAGITGDDEFLRYLAREFVDRRERLFKEIVGAGKMYSDRNQPGTWCFDESFQGSFRKYDLIITNNLLFTDDEKGAYRIFYYGGMESGHAPYVHGKEPANSVAVLSLFPYLNRDVEFLSDTYFSHLDDNDVKTELAILITHELGHSLLHEGHVYHDWNCVMNHNYVEAFDKKEWKRFYNELGACKERKPMWYIEFKDMQYLFDHEKYQEAYDFADKLFQQNPDMEDSTFWDFKSYELFALFEMGRTSECMEIGKEYLDPGEKKVGSIAIMNMRNVYENCALAELFSLRDAGALSEANDLADEILENEKYLYEETAYKVKSLRIFNFLGMGMNRECVGGGEELRKQGAGFLMKYENRELRLLLDDIVSECREKLEWSSED